MLMALSRKPRNAQSLTRTPTSGSKDSVSKLNLTHQFRHFLQGLSSFLTLWLFGPSHHSPFDHPVLYLLLFVLGSTAVLQLRYLNQAMEKFGNTETVKRMRINT